LILKEFAAEKNFPGSGKVPGSKGGKCSCRLTYTVPKRFFSQPAPIAPLENWKFYQQIILHNFIRFTLHSMTLPFVQGLSVRWIKK